MQQEMPNFRATAAFVGVLMGGLYDKSGLPLLNHCMRVALRIQQECPGDDEVFQIAMLHDVVEDTCMTLTELRRMGYSARVLAALELLTHDDAEMPYDRYIAAIVSSGNLDAIRVKLADMRDNTLEWRMTTLPEHEQAWLQARYAEPLKQLEQALISGVLGSPSTTPALSEAVSDGTDYGTGGY